MDKKVLDFALQQGYSDVIKEKPWRGYDVYSPIYGDDDGSACVGLPLIILVKNGKIRLSTEDEAFAYLDETDDVA
jgi:hypothetical protein